MSREHHGRTRRSGRSLSGVLGLVFALTFVFAGVIWPLLHMVGGSLQREALPVLLQLGVPSFFLANICAALAQRAHTLSAVKLGRITLGIVWGAVALVLSLLLGTLTWDVLRAQ